MQLKEQIEPRLACAMNWSEQYVPEDERTHVQTGVRSARFTPRSATTIQARIALLLEKLDANWSMEGITHLVYGVPKMLLGLPMDAAPNDQMKLVQREFFKAMYQLMVKSDTGPRLPTLFLSIGKDRVKALLSSPSVSG